MITVTGATGNVGRALVEALTEAGEEVTAVSRGTGHDLTNPQSLRPAFEGSEALFLLGMAGDPEEILDIAKTSGVERVVLLSSQAAGTRPRTPSHEPFRRFERALRGSSLLWTILRPGGFATNAFQWAEQVRTGRMLQAPFGDVALPIVDPADIAAVAAVALRSADHAGRTYELSGPARISPRDQARAIAAAIGEPVEFAELSRAQARARMLRFMPAPIAEGTLDILGEPTPDEQRVRPGVELVLGRAPGTFEGWASRNADAFR